MKNSPPGIVSVTLLATEFKHISDCVILLDHRVTEMVRMQRRAVNRLKPAMKKESGLELVLLT